MAESKHMVDVTEDTFEAEVIGTSGIVPVVVDFWAPWCGPCQTLMPLLARLAEIYAGGFRLAKVNIDEQPDLAARFGVRSVPTVKVVRHGDIVDGFVGALPESQIRGILDRHVERASDKLAAEAMARIKRGDVKAGIAALSEAAEGDPDNHRIRLMFIEALIESGDYEAGANMLRALPASVATEAAVATLQARLEFATAAQAAPPIETLQATVAAEPCDSHARYQLSAVYILRGEYEAAMEQLLEILRRDRAFGDDAGRKGLLKVFELLGGNGELVTHYRGLMSAALF